MTTRRRLTSRAATQRRPANIILYSSECSQAANIRIQSGLLGPQPRMSIHLKYTNPKQFSAQESRARGSLSTM